MKDGLQTEVDDAQFVGILQKMAAGLGHQPEAMRNMADALFQFILSPFRTTSNAVDPWGVQWHAWSDATKLARQHRKPADFRIQILVDSRDMVSSIVQSSDDSTATVSAGNSNVSDYMLAQQFGTNNAGRGGSVVIPARAFFPMHSEDEPAFPQEWIRAFEPILQAGIDRYVEDLQH
jgi:phage gpG-like protein